MSNRFVPASIIYSFFRSLCRIGTTLMFDLKVFGLENIPPTGGALLLSNHHSFLDPPCIGVQIRRPVSYLAKSGLFEVPLLKQIIPRLNAFPVRQGAGDIGAIRETIKRLKEGHILTIFPEGSRSPDGKLQPIQGGFTLIVRKVDVPIIPVVIEGTFKAWPQFKKLPTSTPVRLIYGKPLDVQGKKSEEIVQLVQQAWVGLQQELHQKMAALEAKS